MLILETKNDLFFFCKKNVFEVLPSARCSRIWGAGVSPDRRLEGGLGRPDVLPLCKLI